MDLPVEFACPACGAPIRTDREDVSGCHELVCPGCGRRVTVAAGKGPAITEEHPLPDSG